jgi:hypothetical protein
VPHHASNVTASVGFYQKVQALVYLISARQTFAGSPSLSVLEAIAKGSPSDPAAMPRLLFFSNPTSLNQVNSVDSNVKQLLNGKYKPNTTGPGPILNYRCYRLRKNATDTDAERRSAGRILFGGDVNGNLVVQFTVAPNDNVTPDTNDWVLMTG